MNPKVSIIVPCYKSEKHIRQCVESILAQTFTDWEAIFIIDCPDLDKTGDILSSYKDKRIVINPCMTKGNPATARNRGLKFAKGEYIAFLDSDDWWYQEKLKLQVKTLEDNPSKEWAFSKATTHQGIKEYPYRISSYHYPEADEMIPFQTFILRRSLIEKMGSPLFNESLNQIDDYELFLRLKEYQNIGLPLPLAHFRINPDGLSNSISRIQTLEQQLKINISLGLWKNVPRILSLIAQIKIRIVKNKIDEFRLKQYIDLQIEPTTRCNLSCMKCSRGKDTPIIDISKEKLLEIVWKYPRINNIIFQGLGEPFLHHDFERMCHIAKQSCRSLVVITNGTKITPLPLKYIDHLVVSLDTMNPDFARVTKGWGYNLLEVKLATETIASMDRPTIDVNFVRSVSNSSEENEVRKFCEEIGIPLHVTPIQNWFNPEQPEWEHAHIRAIQERALNGPPESYFKNNCPFLKGKKIYFDARGIRHPCCIRMRYDQVQPTPRMCETCPY